MSDIRKCFTSRFDKGRLIEVDFSQLEVAVLAFLSQDTNLMQDIENELDMHLVSASWVSGEDYDLLKGRYDGGCPITALLRKEAKTPRFELQYGAGPHTIAKNNGWPLAKAKDYIKRYYDRYPAVRGWQELVSMIVEGNAKTKTGWVKGEVEEKVSFYTCPHTKRRYVFTTYPNKRGGASFSPTQMKNYPVQGFATADLVPTVLGEVVNYIYSHELEDKILLINTVHDSVLFDIDVEDDTTSYEVVKLIQKTFGLSKEIMKSKFNVDINVPLRYNVSAGHNWGEMKELDWSGKWQV